MTKIGFIGYGSMGSMLVKGFIHSGKVKQEQIMVTRRDKSRLTEVKASWPGINITESLVEVAKTADIIFLCVKPKDYSDVLQEIKSFITKDKHIISITSGISMNYLESMLHTKITKIIPTLVSEINEGVTLICHNKKVTKEDITIIQTILSGISKLKYINEEDFGFASDFTSCAPGFIAAIFKEFVEAGIRKTDSISDTDIEDMVLYTLLGTAKLMLEKNMKFDQVIKRVAVKGGITEEGVKVLEKELPIIFDELLQTTNNKRVRGH
jgi:pyrroline-5-carboxylate reductase